MSKLKLIIIFLVVALTVGAGVYFLLPEKQEEKVYRVGILSGLEFFADLIDYFKEEMAVLGYIEGENIIYDIYQASEKVGNEQAIRKFIEDGADLILVFPTEASLEAKAIAADSGVPIVFTSAFIEGTGLVESVRISGGNITGVRYPTTESATGRLEILYEIAPQIKHVWIPYLKDYPTIAAQIESVGPVAEFLDITVADAGFSSPQEIKDYLDELTASGDIKMDAILMLAEPFSVTPEVTEAVFKFAEEQNLPVSSALILEDVRGPIIGFHPENAKMGRLAAPLADKVLKGVPAGTIPVVTADNDLRVNYNLIQKLGLTVGEDLLSRAIKVVR